MLVVFFFRNKEFLPKEYCKVKGIEKKIFQVGEMLELRGVKHCSTKSL